MTGLTLTYGDLDKLLEKAKESGRDLRIEFDADGRYEIAFTVPQTVKSTMEYGVVEEQG